MTKSIRWQGFAPCRHCAQAYRRRVTVHALIVAGGRGVRAGDGVPKQYRAVAGKPVLRHAVEAFVGHPAVAAVQVVIHPDDAGPYAEAIAGLDLLPPVPGGATRQASVVAGLAALGGATTS